MLAALADPCLLHRHLARTYNFGSGVRFGGDGFVEVLAATQTPTGEHCTFLVQVKAAALPCTAHHWSNLCTLGLLLCYQLHILPSAVEWRCLLTAVHFALPASCCATRRRPCCADKEWFQGTADAVRQYNWMFEDIKNRAVQDIVILSGDHL